MFRPRTKFASFVSAAMLVLIAAGGVDATAPKALQDPLSALRATPLEARSDAAAFAKPRGAAFQPEKGLAGEHLYIIQLEDAPVASYRGGIRGYTATSIRGNRNLNARGVLDAKSPASQAYAAYLEARQADFKSRLEQRLGRGVQQVYSYKFGFNGLALRLTQDEAARAAALPNVRRVTRDRYDPIDTSDSVAFIGAPGVWDGSQTGFPGAMGEGIIIGVLDTGIDPGNPSFAEVADDGHVHTNPYGDGVFLGECNDFPGLCNNKVVGCYSFVTGGDPLTPPGAPGCKDTDGHGSHTASTAAGNIENDATIHDIFGNDSGFSFGTINGVAPHANIIAYKVCAPSCGSADRVAAIDQAIIDGVNAVNHSISSSGGSPWNVDVANAFLNARAAGIMVHNSAGNSGPGPGTAAVGGNAPWVTSVGASTHDREIPDKMLINLAGGDTPPPGDLGGKALTDGLSGPIVYAGDFDNGDPNPEQCLNPFPKGTFTADQIVVCDRGTIARVLKCAHVAEGGAGGCVLANVDPNTIVADPHIIPAIHISDTDGNALKAWLASGTGHSGTITATPDPINNPDVADILAGFSSRGPYTGFDFLAPSVSAPGVDVLAAGADLPAFGVDNDNASVAGKWGIISGTSMSSPHAAGSSMLLKQVHPDWTAAEILSALMTTGNTSMLKEDGVTPADPFDFGGGRIQPAEAARAGLVLDETATNFDLANPELGGDPSTLNVASMVSNTCAPTCSWERTLRNVTGGPVSYEVTTSAAPGMALGALPTSFSLADGESQTISVHADVTFTTQGTFSFGEVQLTPQTEAGGLPLPTQHLPVAAFFATASDPNVFVKSVDKAEADNGEVLTYELVVTNRGPDDVFTVTDTVPGNAIFVENSETEVVDGGMTISPWQHSAGTLTWSGQLDPTVTDIVPSASPFGYLSMASLGVAPLGCPGNCDDGGFIIGGVNISFLGATYTDVILSVNGTVELGTASGLATSASNLRLPDPAVPNNLMALFWTDLNLGDGGNWYAANVTDGVTIWTVFEWEGVPRFADPTTYTFQMWAQHGSEDIWFVYAEVPAIPAGNLTVGFEDSTGTVGTSYFFDGEGTEPMVGVDLKPQAEAGGSATLGFQVTVNGVVGDTVLNVGEAANSSTMESAIAITTITGELDTDGDGITDDVDNCTRIRNVSQCDSDGDGFGNHCDADFDNNGISGYQDVMAFRAALRTPSDPPDYSEFDLNCSGGVINFGDVFLMMRRFGYPPGPGLGN